MAPHERNNTPTNLASDLTPIDFEGTSLVMRRAAIVFAALLSPREMRRPQSEMRSPPSEMRWRCSLTVGTWNSSPAAGWDARVTGCDSAGGGVRLVGSGL